MTYNEKFHTSNGGKGDIPVAEFRLPDASFESDLFLCAAHAQLETNFEFSTPLDALCDSVCDVCWNTFIAADHARRIANEVK